MRSLSNRISRGESQEQESSNDVHFFSSYFTSNLKANGPKRTVSQNKKDNVNVFWKKILFLPIQAAEHWSLCVVVSPGLIENSFDTDLDPTKEHAL